MIDAKEIFKFNITRSTCHARCFATSWVVPADLPYLDGHFPSQPIVPAVAIVDASFELLRQATVGESRATGVSNGKFLAPVTPGLPVEITLHQLNLAQPGEYESWQVDWSSQGSAASALAKIQFTAAPAGGFSR